MVAVRFTPNPPGLQQVLESPSGPVCTFLSSLAPRLVSEARAQVGVDSGALQRAITTRPSFGHPNPYIRFGVFEPGDVGYSLYHHEGTRPHVIRPRTSRYLIYTDRRTGRRVYATIVHHPGTRPNPYLVDAATRVGLNVVRGASGLPT